MESESFYKFSSHWQGLEMFIWNIICILQKWIRKIFFFSGEELQEIARTMKYRECSNTIRTRCWCIKGSQVGRGGDESILRAINLPQRITRNGNITFFIGICKEEIYFLENLRLSQLFSFPVKKNHSNWITSVFWWVSPSGLILTVG